MSIHTPRGRSVELDPGCRPKQPCDLVLAFLSHGPGPAPPVQVPSQWSGRSLPKHPVGATPVHPPGNRTTVCGLNYEPWTGQLSQMEPHWLMLWKQSCLPWTRQDTYTTEPLVKDMTNVDPTVDPAATRWPGSNSIWLWPEVTSSAWRPEGRTLPDVSSA